MNERLESWLSLASVLLNLKEKGKGKLIAWIKRGEKKKCRNSSMKMQPTRLNKQRSFVISVTKVPLFAAPSGPQLQL